MLSILAVTVKFVTVGEKLEVHKPSPEAPFVINTCVQGRRILH